MSYPYHFSSLDEDQTERRRQLLNSYGQSAQLSVLLLPLIYQVSLGIQLIVRRFQLLDSRDVLKDHQVSRSVSRFKKSEAPTSTVTTRRLSWFLNGEIVQGWGTRQEWLIAGLWTMWPLILVIRDTGDDYLHLTRRFGIVAASQLPIHYLLALKSWSPVQYLTRLSHESLNPYHHLLGRIITLLLTCHGTLYLNFYIQHSLLLKRIRDLDVQLGLLALGMALAILTTALARVRDWNYRIFFSAHVILSFSLLPTLYFHVPYLRVYILEAATIYVLLIFQRKTSQISHSAAITLLPGTRLLSISVPTPQSFVSRPGQHIYLAFPALKGKLRLNPFTIASLHSKDKCIQLIAARRSGTTALLAGFTKQPQPTRLLVEGPYGMAGFFPDLATGYNRVLLVAGGVGATFTLPLFRDLFERGAGWKARFVWAIRGQWDAEWGLSMLREKEIEGVEMYVSGDGCGGGGRGGDGEEIETGKMEELLFEGEGGSGMREKVKKGRPHLKAIVDEVFAQSPDDRVAVLFCGPPSMGAVLRSEVGNYVTQGREVFFHGERFGW